MPELVGEAWGLCHLSSIPPQFSTRPSREMALVGPDFLAPVRAGRRTGADEAKAIGRES